ncbi:MAG: hypothetical protein F4219_05810, partial [Gammaproteobacteria bacterium]|nr:hypothetical protein [Gammaproteobacteria bacterium]
MFFTDNITIETFPFASNIVAGETGRIGVSSSIRRLTVAWYPDGVFIPNTPGSLETRDGMNSQGSFGTPIRDPNNPFFAPLIRTGLIVDANGNYRSLDPNPQSQTRIDANRLITLFKSIDANPETVSTRFGRGPDESLASDLRGLTNRIDLKIPREINTQFNFPCLISGSKSEARLRTQQDTSVSLSNTGATEDNIYIYVPVKMFDSVFDKGRKTEARAKARYINYMQ